MCRWSEQQPWGGHEYSAVHTDGSDGVEEHAEEGQPSRDASPVPGSAYTLPILLLSSLLLLFLLLVYALHSSLTPSNTASAAFHLRTERQSAWSTVDTPTLSLPSSPAPPHSPLPSNDPPEPLHLPTEAAPANSSSSPNPHTPPSPFVPLPPPPLPLHVGSQPSGLVEVFMLAGQSNMVGFGRYDASLCPSTLGRPNAYSHPSILQLGRYPHSGYSENGDDSMRLLPATDPLEHWLDYGNVTACNRTAMVGPGMSFASTYRGLTGSNVTLVPCARENLAITEWRVCNVHDPSARGMLYVDCVVRVNFLLEQHPTWRFGGILWLQGETDGMYPYPDDPNAWKYAQYIHQSRLRDVLAGFRKDTLQGKDAAMVVGQLSRDWVHTSGWGMTESVQWGLTHLPFDVNHTAVVYSLDEHGRWLSGRLNPDRDPIHYSVASARELGVRYAYGVLAARHNHPAEPVPGIIVQLFVPSHCYLPLDDSPPPLSSSPSSPAPFQCVAIWVPDPHAVSYRLRLATPVGQAEVSTPSNAPSHRLVLPETLRVTPALPALLHVQVASVRAAGQRGEWSVMGKVKLVHLPSAQSYTSSYPARKLAPWPYAWFSAQSLASHLQVGELVGPEWLDVSGAGHALNSPQPPTLVKAVDGSERLAVRFDGSQWLTSPTAFPHLAQAVTVLLVLIASPKDSDRAALLTRPYSIQLYTQHRGIGVEQVDADGHTQLLPIPDTQLPYEPSPVILGYTLTGSDTSILYNHTTLATHPCRLRLNASSGELQLAAPLGQGMLGSGDGDDWRWRGDLLELLLFDSALTQSQHQAVVSFLNQRLHSSAAPR